MMHKELELEKQCRNYARSQGWVACKLEKNGHKGIPDDLLISPKGRCILVEFKKDEHQKLRPEQQRWREKYPTFIFLCSSFTDFVALLESQSDPHQQGQE